MDVWIDINAYHWLALGLLLAAAEALGTAGFLLGTAAAALAVGLVMLLTPDFGLPASLALFAGLSVVATVLYLKVFRDEQAHEPDLLNHRAEQLVGTEFDLDTAVPAGASRIQIGDTIWRVQADGHIEPGTRVRIVGADAMSLRIRPL